jgi:tetratricopeptide (TPR) repeat protein
MHLSGANSAVVGDPLCSILLQLLILHQDPRAYELAQELDGLPLALATAGAYLSQVSTSFANYLQLYNASWLRLQQKTPQLLSYEDRALYSTWGISLEYVKQQSTSAFKLLQLWAYFDRQDVWFELLHKCQGNGQDWFSELTEDQLSFDEAVRVLCDHALVEVDITLRDGSAESRGYSMHSCVHSWTKNVVNKEWDNELASLAICCVSSQVLERSSPQYWVTDRRLVGHGDRCLAFIRNMRMEKDDNLLIPEAARNLAVYYSRQGRLREAEELYELGLKRSKDAAKPRKFEIEILNNLGNLFLQSDRLEEADEMFRQALDISERTFSPEHRLSLRTVNHLGVCLLQKGQLDEAGVMLERALEGRRDVCRPDHLSTSETALNLGQLYSRQGDNDKAQKMLLMALRGREGVLGANHPLTLETVSNLGNLHYMQGKPAETKKRFCQALEGFEQAYGPDHTSTLQLACNLGQLYMEYHELVQAEKMFSRAWRGYEQAFGTNLTLRLGMINDLGFLYVIQGKVDEAEEMYLQALAGREKALGPDHTSTLDTVKNLGSLYVDQGKLDEAEEMYRRALAGYEKRLSSEHARCRDLCETLAFLESDIAS